MKQKGEMLLIPEVGGWQSWSFANGVARLVETVKEPRMAKVERGTIMALPVGQVYCVPIWLATRDESLMRDMVLIQLERRGIKSDSSASMTIQYSVVAHRESETLVLVAVVPSSFPASLCMEQVGRFELSSRLFPIPSNHVAVWKEGDQWVLAIMREGQLAYTQALCLRKISAENMHEIRCVLLELQAQGVVTQLEGIRAFGDIDPREAQYLGEGLKLPCQVERRPAPQLPSVRWDLMPRSVVDAHAQRRERNQKRWVLIAVVLIYLAMVGVLVVKTVLLARQKQQWAEKIAASADEVDKLRVTARRWKALEPSINPNFYPLEVFYRCLQNLPSQGVRLTRFDASVDKILDMGEAESAPSAFAFAEAVKKNPELAAFRWQMPQPRLLPNNSAQFQLEGGVIHATTDTK